MNARTNSWYAKRYIDKYKMALIPIKPASKLPLENDWGNKAILDSDQAGGLWDNSPGFNIGLALGPSNMCSLDIDCMDSFRMIADEFGIDLDAELANVPTIQGASEGMRCMFRIPEQPGVMDYHKISWPSKLDPTGDIHRQMMRDAMQAKKDGNTELEQQIRDNAKQYAAYTVLELRVSVGDKQRYDVLPPSIHPETGKPYKWIVQPTKSLEEWPEPPAWLMAIWNAWDSFKPQLVDACPWTVKEVPPAPKAPVRTQDGGGNVIQAFIDAHPLTAVLEQYGYKRVGKRYLSPHTTTKLPGVVIFPDGNRCFIHHASDPLCSDDSGQPVNSFDLFCYYDHGGDISKAVKDAADLLGLKFERKQTPQAMAINPPEQMTEFETYDTGIEEAIHATVNPFRALGYNGNSYYYLPRGTEQVAEVKKGSHTSPAELMSLAPLEWWEMAYPKGKAGGADWQAAANDCMRACERRGIYSQDRERGRGAWYDAGRAVLHLGNRLLVDGQQMQIPDHESEYIYTRQAPLEHGADAVPATDDEAGKIADIFKQLNWHKPVYGDLLAGWCLLAPICGALSWRPHVWITAQRGAGKSWVQDHVIQPMIGPAAMMVQGSTTEAGIRQRVRQDARPIVFDEAESEDQRSQNRMQTVIELARQASSDSSAEIIKGTVSGHGMAFRMRSMFLLGSVNVSLSQAADESRFSVLSLATPAKTIEESERFSAFSKLVDNTLTDEACASIRARAYQMMPVIRANCKTFARAVAEVLGSQRIGDQVGTLLAGAHAYKSSEVVTLEEARELVRHIDFSDAKEAEQVSDEESCLQRILQSQVRFDTEQGNVQRSLGEVIDMVIDGDTMFNFSSNSANDVLKRYGLTVEDGGLIIANNHAELEKILQGSPWAAGWRRILARIDGAELPNNPVRFAGTRSRGVKIPISFIR